MMRIMVDMSATLLHHGHIRLLRVAKNFGAVIVALTTDEEILIKKGYLPELNFEERREIVESIKYVDEVVPSKWELTQEFLDSNNIDFLMHGADNSNKISPSKLMIYPRTENISSSIIRVKAHQIYLLTQKNKLD